MTKSQVNKFIKYFQAKKYKVHDFLEWGNKIGPFPSFKTAMFPQGEVLIKYKETKQEEILDKSKRVLLGVNILDLKAMNLWHQVFEKDPYWQAKIRNTVVIGRMVVPLLNKGQSSVLEPFEENTLEHIKFDIFLFGKGNNYKVFTGSEKGQSILDDFGYQKYEHVDYMGPVKEEGIDKRILKIRNKLKDRYVKEIWEKIGDKCIECGKCTIACPTCFCFDVKDKPSLKKGEGEKVREYSSCLFPEFSEVAGGHKFQKSTAERLYFWYYHKFVRTIDEFSMPGCVGCGRCAKACPVGIDIKKVLDEIIKS